MDLKKIVLVLAVGLLSAADPKTDAAKKEVEKLQGEWSAVSIDYNGKSYEKIAQQLKFVFKGDTAVVQASDAVKKEYAKLTFKFDPSTTPKCVDMTVAEGVQKGTVMEGIYELKDDQIKICAKVFGKDRPTEFAAPAGSSLVVIVLKRDKP